MGSFQTFTILYRFLSHQVEFIAALNCNASAKTKQDLRRTMEYYKLLLNFFFLEENLPKEKKSNPEGRNF